VDLTADTDNEDDMENAPATFSPNVSDDDNEEEMDTADEDGILAYKGQGQQSESSSDGFEHT